jgi:hypothetical protein
MHCPVNLFAKCGITLSYHAMMSGGDWLVNQKNQTYGPLQRSIPLAVFSVLSLASYRLYAGMAGLIGGRVIAQNCSTLECKGCPSNHKTPAVSSLTQAQRITDVMTSTPAGRLVYRPTFMARFECLLSHFPAR